MTCLAMLYVRHPEMYDGMQTLSFKLEYITAYTYSSGGRLIGNVMVPSGGLCTFFYG